MWLLLITTGGTMNSIDKNDVDISKLFKWNRKAEVKDSNGEVVLEVYLRLLGDADINRVRVAALRASASLRRKLNDPNSDEFLAYIPELEFVERESLIEGILIQSTRDFTQQALKELKFNLPVEPHSEATLEEQEKFQAEVDAWSTKREDTVREYVLEKIERKREEISELPTEVLYKDYIKKLINFMCEEELMKTYREQSIFYGAYTDDTYTTKVFNSIEEYNNLSPIVKEQLQAQYIALELDGEDLKKLPEATQ